MTKLLVEDTSLVSVADAIRTKGGTTGALTFPNGFVSAVEGIKTGVSLTPFVDGSITEITADMLDGCTKIADYGFYQKKNITSVVLPSSVSSIGAHAFEYCNALENVSIPEGVKSIGKYAFMHCTSLSSVVLPRGISSIAEYSFGGCYALDNVLIPQNVNVIYNYAFDNCKGLTTIIMERTTPPKLNSNVFRYCSALTTIKVPSASLNAYKSATNWSAYADKMVGV